MLELWGTQSTSLLPLPQVHSLGMVAPDRVQSVGQIELNSVLFELFENRTFFYV